MLRKKLEDALTAGKNLYQIGDYKILKPEVQNLSEIPQASINRKIKTYPEKLGVYSLAFNNQKGDKLAVGFGNGSIILYDVKSGRMVHEVTPGRTYEYATMNIRYLDDQEHFMTSSAHGDVTLWKETTSSTNKVQNLSEIDNEVNALDICKSESHFATAGKQRHIRLYDITRFEICSSHQAADYNTISEANQGSGHTKRIFALRFHPQNNSLFLTGGWDNCVKVWDKRILRSPKLSLFGPHICGNAIDVNDNLVLTGSWTAKNSLQMWDLRKGTLNINLPFVESNLYSGQFLYCAKFASNDSVLAGGSGTNSACSVSLNSTNVLSEIKLEKSCYAIDTCQDGSLAAVAGLGGNILIASLPS